MEDEIRLVKFDNSSLYSCRVCGLPLKDQDNKYMVLTGTGRFHCRVCVPHPQSTEEPDLIQMFALNGALIIHADDGWPCDICGKLEKDCPEHRLARVVRD